MSYEFSLKKSQIYLATNDKAQLFLKSVYFSCYRFLNQARLELPIHHDGREEWAIAIERPSNINIFSAVF